MSYHTFSVDYEDDRGGDAVAWAARRVLPVEHVEGADDLRLRVRQQGEADPPALGEARQLRDAVIADRRDVVAEGGEFPEFKVPGDRLGLAIGSPVERAGEQQDKAALAGERPEAPLPARLVGRVQLVGNRLADPHTLAELVVRSGRGDRRRKDQRYAERQDRRNSA